MQTLLSLIIIAAVLWFAITNAAAITVNVFLWEINASLALVIAGAFLLGFLLGVLRLAPALWRNRKAARMHELAHAELKKERDALAERASVLEDQVRQLAPLEDTKSRTFAQGQ
jgi:uncharacterized integral membrane protein